MPEPYPILNSLMLEQTGENRFRGPSVPSDFRPVVFGGQLMGQMIVAAAATLPDKNVKSLHAIFARAGTVKEPVDLDVDVMHAGRALASATVTARQGDRLLSRGLLLLDAGEPDLIRADAWLLLAQQSLFAGHGRTYGSGQVFDEHGNQVASFVQENLVRAFRNEPGT